MIDSHCHLDFTVFDDDREQILQDCRQKGIKRILIPGTVASGYSKQLQLAQQYSGLDIAFGLHPFFLTDSLDHDLQQLEKAVADNQQHIVAIGEIGLDFAITDRVGEALQEKAFLAQLQLAEQYQLPVILHHRKSHNELIRLLKIRGFKHGGAIHAFSGSLQVAEQYIELGFKLGVGGSITYPRAQKTRETLAEVPLSAILLETDAPDMPLNGKQGQRNTPINLPLILECLAQLRQEQESTIVEKTTQTYTEMFLRSSV